MTPHKIPAYYTDPTLTEEQKIAEDWKMIAKDFPLKSPMTP